MADHFAFRELRIRQPGKVLPGRARYEIFDPDKNLVAVATETESRGVLQTVIGLVPGTRVLAVRTPAGEPILTLVRQDSENDWLAALTDPDGKPIGKIRIEFSRRHYTLLDDQGQVAGKAAGDLGATQFSVTGAEGERYAQIRKTWAGPRQGAPHLVRPLHGDVHRAGLAEHPHHDRDGADRARHDQARPVLDRPWPTAACSPARAGGLG